MLNILRSEDGEIFVFSNKRPRFLAKIHSFVPFYLEFEMWESMDFYKDHQFKKDQEKIIEEFVKKNLNFDS